MAEWKENEKNSGIQYYRFLAIDDTYFLLLDDEVENYKLLIQSERLTLWESEPKNLET